MEFNGRKQKGITTRYNDEILEITQPSGIEENAFAFVPKICNLFSALVFPPYLKTSLTQYYIIYNMKYFLLISLTRI